MKLALDKKQGNRIEFIAKGIDTTFANVVRRHSLSRIPVLAIESITFYDNSSAFWDEYIAHRLGLFPILTPENVPESTEVILSLDAEGPKKVYASDMVSSDKEITVAKGNIPVVTLGPNQHLRLEAKAVLGTAMQHAKYQAGLMSYGDEDGDLRIMVESFFQMEPKDVLDRACEVVDKDLTKIEDVLLGKKPKKPAKKEKAGKEEKKPAKKAEKKEETAEKEEKKPAKKTTKKAAKKETKKAAPKKKAAKKE